MKEVRSAAITIYCDEPSHVHRQIGPFLTGHWTETMATLARAADIENRIQHGPFIVSQLERRVILSTQRELPWHPVDDYTGSGKWIRLRNGGGKQWLPLPSESLPEGVFPYLPRFSARCGWCGLSLTRQWGPFEQDLDALRASDVTAVSLRTLIEARQRG